MASSAIDMFISHQPCHWAHTAWRDSVGISPQNSYETFNKYCNIASATVPINLFEAEQKGLLKDGSNVLIMSPGADENHIAAIIRWGR